MVEGRDGAVVEGRDDVTDLYCYFPSVLPDRATRAGPWAALGAAQLRGRAGDAEPAVVAALLSRKGTRICIAD